MNFAGTWRSPARCREATLNLGHEDMQGVLSFLAQEELG
jgi:hypothetical protein